MTEQEYCDVMIKSHLRAIQKLLSEANSYQMRAKHHHLIANAYNAVSQVIKALDKRIKIEEEAEVKP